MKSRSTARLMIWLFLALAPDVLASTTWYVDWQAGNDEYNCMSPETPCKTIFHAIELASSGDSILVAAGRYPSDLSIDFDLTIIGSTRHPGTFIIGSGVGAAVITIPNANTVVTLSNLTITNGQGQYGGGINTSGILTINDSTVSGNVASPMGRWKAGGLGGGIFINGGTVEINNSTIVGNKAEAGGGIFNFGTLTVSNSTIARNTATGGAGGGIYQGEPTVLENTIVADNSMGKNCSGVISSNGYNLSSDESCNFNGPGDLNNTDPQLGALRYNGGPTQTMALPAGSPAVNAGNPSGCTDGEGHLLSTDQRGKRRPDKKSGRCDIGAYELKSN